MIELNNITVVCIDCYRKQEAIMAIKKTLEQVKPKAILFFTDVNLNVENVETILIPTISSKNEYSRFVVKELYKYIETDFILIIQHDGYVLDYKQWDEHFLDYDYIGSSWLYPDTERNVGNGGFSLRSLKLMTVLGTDNFINVTEQEDDAICRLYGAYLEKEYDIKFSPVEIANKFSFELNQPINHTFGFHGYFNKPFKDVIVLKRTGAMGDVVMMEPVMEYYHNKGYEVFIDTQIQYMNLFYQQPYPVKHISLLNKKIKPYVIDLDMSYEKTPKQLALKSYYETCGIMDGEIRNSKLYSGVTIKNKLFRNKYVVIHNDDTGIPHRNVYGINWDLVAEYLKNKGYDVFQVGKRDHVSIKETVHFNSSSELMLMMLLKGADFVIGIDSGVAQVSVALGIKCIIFSGSVNLKYRYADFSNIKAIQNNCDRAGCYHETVSTTGQSCFYSELRPPCTQFSNIQVIDKINKTIN